MQIDHPFIMKLVRTFKDSERVYYLTELVNGDDLFDALQNLNILNKEQSLFYFVSLLFVLEYLHNRSIIYRDLKPENVMIDDTGYVKLIDMGTAKIVHDRTYTLLGTPVYTAPEVIIGNGYAHFADYWSLSVCLYEFLCGCLPFGDENEEDPF